MSGDCRIRDGAVVTIGGHGPAVAMVTVACVHEHVTPGLPACAACLERHAADPLCCVTCEMSPRIRRHCCPVTLRPEIAR